MYIYRCTLCQGHGNCVESVLSFLVSVSEAGAKQARSSFPDVRVQQRAMETYAIYRAGCRLGTGAAWGPAEQRVWSYLAARPLPGKAGPPGYRERRGAGGLPDHFPNDLIPFPGTSQALQVRLCLWAILGEETSPVGFLSSSSSALQRVNRCAVERGNPEA